MDFKQAIIENAWGGFNMDYGLLHLQLATPLTVLAFILLMIFLLNKLFFQPVLRTLDQRKENIQGSMKQSERLSKELERMQSDFQHKHRNAPRVQVHEEPQLQPISIFFLESIDEHHNPILSGTSSP